ncbi:hypothetical protein EDD86DRAFT_223811 [Gorgonomyces haynaldii]|nr:hypothetical protein EDD86DRAFT_223811 [Gorgonomyces haynaldii]
MLLVLVALVLAQNSTCPVCFNCQNTGCKNFGVCQQQSCQCPDGFGDLDCSKTTCGSLNMLSNLRPPKQPSIDCECASGFGGPNCNICLQDNVCSGSQGAILGSQMVCNKSPLVWKQRHHTVCDVNNTLVSAVFPGSVQVTVERSLGSSSAFATLWNKGDVQFSCNVTECAQKSDPTQTSWNCKSLKCQCVPGSAICGGGLIDLTSSVNSANGGALLQCQSNSTDCLLNFDFLSGLLPDGLGLSNCRFGECADQLDAPGALEIKSLNTLDTAGIVGLSIAGVVILALTASVMWAYNDLQVRRLKPVYYDRKGETISFEHVCYEVGKRKILKDITGQVDPGQVMAIMGPSGAGKSTFLDILARKQKNGKIMGTLRFGSEILGPQKFRSLCGFVNQEDTLLSTMTVREAIAFSAKLRLPDNMTWAQKMERVDQIITKLGLDHIKHSRIGDSVTRGISGGEKRRVSIGIELVTNPCVLFLDEPTSGLDSYNATQVMQTLTHLAHKEKKTVIFTVHQPRSDVFAMFDQVLLLSRGQMVFYGTPKEAKQHCLDENVPCPDGYNMADHLLDLASGSVKLAQERTSQGTLARNSQGQDPEIQIDVEEEDDSTKSVYVWRLPDLRITKDQLSTSFLTQLYCVLGRSWTDFYRRPSLFLSHFLTSLLLGTFLGLLYYGVDNSLAGIQNRLGSLFFLQSLMAFAGLSALTTFTSQRVLFIRERSNGFYGPLPFFYSRILFDLIPLRVLPAIAMCTTAFFLIGYSGSPAVFLRFLGIMIIFSMNCALFCLFLGCLIDEFSTATLVASILMLFQMLFAGILVNQVQIPSYLRWVQYLSLFKYAYEAAAANDAAGIRLLANINGITVTIPATTILSSFGIDVNAYQRDVTISLSIFVGLLLLIGLLVKFRLREKR